jgi:hypothetical protein
MEESFIEKLADRSFSLQILPMTIVLDRIESKMFNGLGRRGCRRVEFGLMVVPDSARPVHFLKKDVRGAKGCFLRAFEKLHGRLYFQNRPIEV